MHADPGRLKLSLGALVLAGSLASAACGHKAVVARPPSPPPPKPAAPSRREEPRPPVPPTKTTPAVRTATGRQSAAPPSPVSLPTRGPLIRIGLTVTAEELRITAAGELHMTEKRPEAPRQVLTGPLQVRLEQPIGETREVYRVQVASLASREPAEKLSRQLSERFSMPAVVLENSAAGTNQVRIGRFSSRKEAQDFIAGALAEAGYRDAFIIREAGEAARGEPALTLRGPDSFFRVSRSGYLLAPGAEADFLHLNGKPYRGILDISLGSNGSIMVVNELAIEEYLLGVVPSELNPATYPEPAALAAQAIAARTFALKNLGKFRAGGFDLTDDTRTQVYGGASAEKDGSNDAVRQTAGIAIYYRGSLIDAMYTSTCGGRTEDYSNVFDAPPVPYLTSVVCTADVSPLAAQQANLGGNHDLDIVILADDGSAANRELELAQVLGLSAEDRLTAEWLAGVPAATEAAAWLEKARSLAGRGGAQIGSPQIDISSRAGFLRCAAESFFGSREIDRRISQSDAAYYLSNLSDGASVPASARSAIAYLVQKKLWHPYPDNTVRPDQPVERSQALAWLVRWILSERPEILKAGISADPGAELTGEDGGVLVVKRGNRTERLRLDPHLRLYKVTAGRSMPVAQMRLIGNEKIAFHQRTSGEVDYLEVELSATGASSDRFSPVASWQVTFSRSVVAEKLRPLAGNIGEIRDLKPARLGSSGRVVQLEIVGTRGSTIVNGYRVRNALGLRDTLYTLTRTQADDESIAGFTFDGRGWGHGVGLCQTGAVGMARAGRSAEEILKAYYQGIELRKAY